MQIEAKHAIRFWQRVEKTNSGCWSWTAAKTTPGGYGSLRVSGKARYAHRLVYPLTGRQIPRGKHVLHHCDNPACVRPSHLYVGTASDNAKDAWERSFKIKKGERTHCPHGHELAGTNLYVNRNGHRVCRECQRAARRRFDIRKRRGSNV
jgi:hypothetical protein